MPVRSEKENSVMIPVEISHESFAKFELELDSILRHSRGRILLDCSQLRHASSTQVGLMWLAYQKCKENETIIELVSPPEGLIRILQVLNIDEFLIPGNKVAENASYTNNKSDCVQKQFSYHDTFIADALIIKNSLERLKSFLENAGVPNAINFEICTIFYEVVINIESHSMIGKGENIVFSAEISDNRAVLSFVDHGILFNPTIVREQFDPLKAAKQRKVNGFGLSLISKLINSSSYSRGKDGTNLLVLEKSWSN